MGINGDGLDCCDKAKVIRRVEICSRLSQRAAWPP
jgi:hypothetical protein